MCSKTSAHLRRRPLSAFGTPALRHLPYSRTALPSTMTHGVAIMLALVLIAMAPPGNAQQFYGDVRIFPSVSFCSGLLYCHCSLSRS